MRRMVGVSVSFSGSVIKHFFCCILWHSLKQCRNDTFFCAWVMSWIHFSKFYNTRSCIRLHLSKKGVLVKRTMKRCRGLEGREGLRTRCLSVIKHVRKVVLITVTPGLQKTPPWWRAFQIPFLRWTSSFSWSQATKLWLSAGRFCFCLQGRCCCFGYFYWQ